MVSLAPQRLLSGTIAKEVSKLPQQQWGRGSPSTSHPTEPLTRKGGRARVCACVSAPLPWDREKGKQCSLSCPQGGISTVTAATGPGPGRYHGDQIIDRPKRDISENERGAIKNYAGTTVIAWDCPRRTGTCGHPNFTPSTSVPIPEK